VSDDELVGLALGGDREAFGELVERHQQAVFLTALGALRSREDAEDVTQDTFIRAFGELARFRGDASFKTWVLTIAWNRVRDRRRSLRRWLKTFSQHDGDDDVGGDAMAMMGGRTGERSSEIALIEEQAYRDVRKLVGALPAKFRDPLVLSVFGEQTFETIGRVIGVPVGTAKWRVAEARRLLRSKLERQGHGRGARNEGGQS
jgi:RNA polymerase sigma-70 factor (ECF subfamily)